MRTQTITKMQAARRRLGMSQAELAARIGVTQPRVSLWENRLQDLPPYRRAQIALELDIDQDTLLEDA